LNGILIRSRVSRFGEVCPHPEQVLTGQLVLSGEDSFDGDLVRLEQQEEVVRVVDAEVRPEQVQADNLA